MSEKVKRKLAKGIGSALLGAAIATADATEHPLDPLSFDEHWDVLQILYDAGKVDPDTKFSGIHLYEPDKADVLAWTPGSPRPRQAKAVVRNGGEAFEAVIDLERRRLESYEKLEGVQPYFTSGEDRKVLDKMLEHPDFVAAIKRRGYEERRSFAARSGLRATSERTSSAVVGSVTAAAGTCAACATAGCGGSPGSTWSST